MWDAAAGKLVNVDAPGGAETFSDLTDTPSDYSGAGGWIWLHFASPQLLAAGSVYGLLVGRTDGGDTYPLPVPFLSDPTAEFAVPITGYSHGRSWRVASASLAIGSAITIGTVDSVGAGYMFRYP